MATKKKNKKLKKGIIIGIVVLLVLGFAVTPMIIAKINPTNGYLKTEVKKDTIETYFNFSGSVGSENAQNVMAEKIMQIDDVKIKEGDKVSKDTVLFKAKDGTEVKSKINGTVNKIKIEEDETVMSGSLLCEIIDFDSLEVVIKVDEYDLNSIEIDKEIDVLILSNSKTIKGVVSEISRTAVNQNGVSYFTANVKLPKDDTIKVGMTAETKILNKRAENALLIPIKALEFNEDNTFVYLLKNNKLEKVAVELSITDGKNVEVVSGIKENDTVYYKDSNAGGNEGGFTPPLMNR